MKVKVKRIDPPNLSYAAHLNHMNQFIKKADKHYAHCMKEGLPDTATYYEGEATSLRLMLFVLGRSYRMGNKPKLGVQ